MTESGERIVSIDITHLVRAALGHPAEPDAQIESRSPAIGAQIPSSG
nr:hypothetical protein [Microbacterium hydrocarbonoxydans]